MTGNLSRPAARQRNRSKAKPSGEEAKPPAGPVKPRSTRRTAILTIVLVLLAATFFLGGGLTRLTNHFAEAAMARRDSVAAKDWLEVTEWISPRDPTRFFLAARIARREGDLPRMAEYLEQAGRLGFDPRRVRRERILGLAQSGQLEGIEVEINQWLREGDSEMAEISDAYANGLAIQSRLDAAIRVLQAWHQDYPDDPVPLYRHGRIQEHSDELEEAERNYRAAIASDDQYYPAFYSLGRLLLDDKKPRDAIVFFQHCLAVPNPAAAKVGVARCLIEMGETQRAAELLHEVVELDPEMLLASYRTFGETPERFVAAAELGKLEANAGNFEQAKRFLDLALQENPRDVAARYSRAVALRGLGRQDEAEAEFAYVRNVQKAMEEIKGYQDRIGRDPQDTEARIGLGNLLLKYESERSGLFWLRGVLVYEPDNVKVHQALADYYESHASQSPTNAQLAREHRQQAAAGKAD